MNKFSDLGQNKVTEMVLGVRAGLIYMFNSKRKDLHFIISRNMSTVSLFKADNL